MYFVWAPYPTNRVASKREERAATCPPPDDLAPLLWSKLVHKLDHPAKRTSYASEEGVRCWVVACFVVMVLSVLRGIRLPGSWTYAHYLMNYDFGFTKRGLLGSIVEQVGIPYLASYEFFALFSASILLGNLLLLATLLRDLVKSGNIFLLCCSIILICSTTLPSLANFIGYGDHIGMFITLVVLKIKHFWQKLTFAVPSLLVAILVHEANFIIFAPIILLSLLLNIKENRQTHQLAALIAVSIFWTGSTYLISSSLLTKEQSLAMYDTLQAETDVALNRTAFEPLYRETSHHFSAMKNRYIRYFYIEGLRTVNSTLMVLPFLAASLGTTTFFFLRSNIRRYIISLAIFASLSPLTLNFLGADRIRWFIWSTVTSLFVLYVVLKRYENSLPSCTLPPAFFPLLMIVVFISSITSANFFDGYVMQYVPFLSYQRFFFR